MEIVKENSGTDLEATTDPHTFIPYPWDQMCFETQRVLGCQQNLKWHICCKKTQVLKSVIQHDDVSSA